MKVSQFNFNDIGGGAARAAMRQHRALIAYGIDSQLHVLAKMSGGPRVIPFKYDASMSQRVIRRFRKFRIDRDYSTYGPGRPEGLELFSDDRVHHGDTFIQGIGNADIFNLHWVAGYCDFQSIFWKLLALKPVVWTLHDMNAFTGGCHYDHGCGKFRDQCGSCPQLGSTEFVDLSRNVWIRKFRAIRDRSREHEFCVVTPSCWLAEKARSSSLFENMRIQVVPYGLDTNLFRPQNVMSIRKKYGIPGGDQVILFLASGAGAHRKGFRYLNDAVSEMSAKSEVVVVTVGGELPEVSGKYQHRHLGSIFDDSELSAVYAMSDVFIIPSIEDNLPLACQEALACGTPVIGFDVGGIPDMVIDGETGYLVPKRDVRALKKAIEFFFSDPSISHQLAAGARDHAVKNYSMENNAKAYRQVYESLL